MRKNKYDNKCRRCIAGLFVLQAGLGHDGQCQLFRLPGRPIGTEQGLVLLQVRIQSKVSTVQSVHRTKCSVGTVDLLLIQLRVTAVKLGYSTVDLVLFKPNFLKIFYALCNECKFLKIQ